MAEQRNLILAVLLSILVLLGFEVVWRAVFPPPPVEQTEMADAGGIGTDGSGAAIAPGTAPQAPGGTEAGLPPAPGTPGVPGAIPPTETASRAEVLAATEGGRVTIDTAEIQGSIRLKGARLDDLILTEYRESLDEDSPPIHLFSPAGAPDPYYAEFGWVATGASGTPINMPMPGPDTPWTASSDTLRVGQPVTLTWDNGAGLRFTRTFAVDEHFLFTVTQRVENTSDETLALFPYGLVSRTDRPATTGIWILHEGPLGVFDGTLTEVNYGDLEDEQTQAHTTTGGWIGITDKYWLAALAFDQEREANARFVRHVTDGRERFQVDYRLSGQTLAPGGIAETTNRLFAGAKKVQLLDGYADEFGITNFDLAIDFGWFYFMTKPFFYCLLWLEDLLGNYGLAIIAFVILLKIAFFPLANKAYTSMSKMKKMQPELKKIQERFKDDKPRAQQEIMGLYQREGVNPLSGCMPILIQIPVFFALYKVLFVSIEMRHAPFYGWIQDLSAPDPTNMFTLFGLIPWNTPDILHVGIWPLIMGASMYVQQKLNPAPPDPTQARIMSMLPILFTFILARFAAGLVIYWTLNNILSMAQQWFIMKRVGAKVNP
jgi:YidC/Oxa1 family membrane protein insertase